MSQMATWSRKHLPLLKRLESATVADVWAFCGRQPLGKHLFSKLLALKIPYSGTLGAEVDELSDGHCKVTLRDRRAVRNHLDCIHAIALVNLGELTTGLAVFHALDGRAKGIVTGLRIAYHKKARGTLTASCDVDIPVVTESCELTVEGLVRDSQGDVVSTIWATWTLKPL
jgi:acyl-coenzyme A thioesterase PaaI-like protein